MVMRVWEDEGSKGLAVIVRIEAFALLRKQADFHLVLYYVRIVMKLLNQKAIRVYGCDD